MFSTTDSCVWNRPSAKSTLISRLTFEQALELVEQELDDIFSIENDVEAMFEKSCNVTPAASNLSFPITEQVIIKGSLEDILQTLEASYEYAN